MSTLEPIISKKQIQINTSDTFEVDSDPSSPVIVEDKTGSDCYSTNIVEELLNGTNEWRTAPEIVKITVKALTDIVKAQGESIRSLERKMPTKASNSDLKANFNVKANVCDMNSAIAGLKTKLDDKISKENCLKMLQDYIPKDTISKETCLKMLQDYIPKNNLESLLASKIDKGDFYSLIDRKVSVQELQKEVTLLTNKMMDFKKADLKEFKNLLEAVENKADRSIIERMNRILESKADKAEINQMSNTIAKKIEFDLECVSSSLTNTKTDFMQKMSSLEKKIETVKAELESTKHLTHNWLVNKAETKDLERISQNLNYKADIQYMEEVMRQVRDENNTRVEKLNRELMENRRCIDENMNEAFEKSESLHENAFEEIHKLSNEVKSELESIKDEIEKNNLNLKEVSKSTKSEITRILDPTWEELERIRNGVNDLNRVKLDRKELCEVKTKMYDLIDDLVRSQSSFNNTNTETNKRLLECEADIDVIKRYF